MNISRSGRVLLFVVVSALSSEGWSLAHAHHRTEPLHRCPKLAGDRFLLLGARSQSASIESRRNAPEDDAADLSAYVGKSRVEFRRAIIAGMNAERSKLGLPPFREELRLNRAAADRIRDMERKRYFDHNSPSGVEPFVWIERRGYSYSIAGENLATGFDTAAEVVSGWMNSPSHRENVLDRQFREVGIAIVDDSPVPEMDGPTVVVLYARESHRG